MCGAARRCTTVLQSIDHYGKGRDNRLRRPLRRVAGSGSLPTRRGEIPGRPFPPQECGDTAVPENFSVVCGRVLILPSIHLGRGLGCIVPSPEPHHRSWRSPGEVEKLPRLNPVGASCHSGAGSSRRLASLSRLAIGNERRTEGHNASRFAAEREMIRCCCGGARPSRGRSGAAVSSARSGSTRAASTRWSHTGRNDYEVSVSGDRFEGDTRAKPVDSGRLQAEEEAVPRAQRCLGDNTSPLFAPLLSWIPGGPAESRSKIDPLDSAGLGHYTKQCDGGQLPPRRYAEVAQLVEHLLAKEEVAGSNPVFRSSAPLPGRFSCTSRSSHLAWDVDLLPHSASVLLSDASPSRVSCSRASLERWTSLAPVHLENEVDQILMPDPPIAARRLLVSSLSG